LIGVLVGGALTLSGQVVLEALKGRRDRADALAAASAAARLQRDDIAAALEAAHRALATHEWWPTDLDLPLRTEMQDRRLLASHLTEEEFRRVSGSLRRFAQLQAERKAVVERDGSAAAGLSDEAYYRTLLAYLDVAAARLALARLAGYERDPWPLSLRLDAELEERARRQLRIDESAELCVREASNARSGNA